MGNDLGNDIGRCKRKKNEVKNGFFLDKEKRCDPKRLRKKGGTKCIISFHEI